MNYKPAAMKPQPHLLGDATLQRFIVDGHITVKPTLPDTYHSALKKQLDALIEKNGNPGNDLLPQVSELAELFADPAVDGALTSLLGPDYILHPHRHCHDWNPDSQAQAWHKDYPITGHPRCHRGRWLLLLYYPQTITQHMGPTAIQPRTQHYMDATPDAPGLELCVEAGTVVIAHYDIWHKATANTSDQTRYMLKFLFGRRAEPTAPAWDTHGAAWTPAEGDHRTLSRRMWHWHRGEESPALAAMDPRDINARIRELDEPDPHIRRRAADDLGLARANEAVPALTARLQDTDEPVRLNAAYALAAQNAVGPLLDALRREAPEHWQANLDRGDFTSPSQLNAVYGLAAAGSAALNPLIEALADGEDSVRAAAATALGHIGRDARPALSALAAALNDENEWVRRHAAEAIGQIGPEDITAQALLGALDDCRPVTRWSLSTDSLRETAASTLARMTPLPPTAQQALDAVRDDENAYIRAWAAIALDPQGNSPTH